MPVGFSSAARNLFLLGSSGADAVTNFFKAIDKSSNPNEGYYTPSQIKYNYSDGKFLLSGTGLGNDSFGWVEKRDYDGSNSTSTEEWGVRISPSVYSSALTLTTMELDGNDNVIVVGKYGGVNGNYGTEAPYIAKYSNAGVLDWQSTSSTGDLEYTGVTSDSSGNYYACGNTPDTQISASGSDIAIAYVEKFDSNGNPGWGKAASMPNRDAVLTKIASNNKGAVIAVGYLEDDSAKKGYIVKIDSSTGEVLWDRTIKSQYDPDGLNSYQDVECKDIFIDSSGQIYIVGNKFNHGFIIKYTAEGNIIWQKQTDEGLFTNFTFEQVFSDGETEQAVVFGTASGGLGTKRGLLSKYSKNGDLVWRRFLESSRDSGLQFDNVSLDADPSFYYLLFCDQVTSGMNPTKYTFGKVSTSGNGLGDFQYSSDGSTTIDYKILNAPDQIGRLSDGSVSNSSSDLMSYPFTANKLLFDDLATNISNKKRQMDSADSFEYSGSPAIRVADFQEMNLLGDAGIPETMPVELITNGDFNSSNVTGWSPATLTADLRYSYNNSYNGTNSLIIVNYAAADSFIQSFTTEIGKRYKVSLDQLGGPVIKIFDGSGVSGTTLQTITTTNSGNYETGETGTFVATSTTSTFAVFDIPPGAAYVLDNISVQKDVLGPELITNGGFENDNIDGWTLDQNGGNVLAFYSSGYTGSRSVSLQNLGGSGDPKFYQSFVTEPGKTYYITLQQAGSPTFTIFDGSGLSGTTLRRMTTANTGSVAFDEEAYFKAASSTSTIAITSFGSGAYLMDDISVKEAPITLLWDDQSGKDNSGAILGATHNADGYWEFDGTDDTIEIGDLGVDMSQMTVEIWFKSDTLTNWQNPIDCNFSVPDPADDVVKSGNIGPRLEINASGDCRWYWGALLSDNNRNFPSASTTIYAGQWYHSVLSINGPLGSNGSAYLNGEFLGTGGQNGTAGNTWFGECKDVKLGRGFILSNRHFDGKIGAVRIYPKALTRAQVYQNYNATKTKYIYEAPSTAPLITSDNLSSTSSLLLNYDFGNRATYDPVVNKFTSSANLLKYSDGTASGRLTDWSWLGASTPEAIPNAAIAPDGSLTAWKVSGPSLYQSIINDGDFTMSAWVKTVDGSSASVQQSVYLLGTGGDVLSTTHTATGEWQRITFSSVATSIYGNPAGKYHRYTPFSSSADLYVWGPQVELKSSAGRHVQTYGTAINLSYGFNSLVPYAGNGTFNDEPKNQFIDGTVKCNGTYEFITFSYPSVTVSDGSSSTVSWTAEFWIKPDAFTGSSDIGDLLSDGTYKIQLEQGGSDAGKIRYDYSSTASGFSNVALTAGQWNHVVVKFSPFAAATSVSIQAWINNTFALNTGHTEPLQQIANRFGNGFKGRLAELRIYDTDLTDTAREANWNATRGKYGV